MANIKFLKEGIEVEVQENISLLQCIREAGLKIETPCNAIGLCGKCKVIAMGSLSEPSKEEKKFIDESKNERLACLSKVTGDVEVELINSKKDLKTINRGYSINVEVDSLIRKEKLKSIDIKNSKPYVETLEYKIKSPYVYEKVGDMENGNNDKIYGVVYENEILDIVNDFEKLLGVAIDIGTTGISSYLINLRDGKVLNKISSLNPQTEFGGDVLTRITYCMNNEKGSKELKDTIVKEINRIIVNLLEDNYALGKVYQVVIAGNTTMTHLLLGVSPVVMARAPYRPIFLNAVDIKGKHIDINMNTEGVVTILPGASAYVGADIVSGIVASDFQNKRHASIFVDIGTNGEIAAINGEEIMATSTAAGPALEGMNISCGCRACEGAIECFDIDKNYNITYSTIGNIEPIGICGSGLIDIAAALVRRNIILKSGKFTKELDDRIKDRLEDKKFYITDKVYISQKDIRQIQLAKGAISAGIIMLLKEIHINIEEVKEAVIAGAFGYHVNPDSIKTIGLIPKGFKGEINFVGNTSLEGARLALINKKCLEDMKKLKENMKVLELSTSDKFQEYFIKELSF